jgi:hypothetical protein
LLVEEHRSNPRQKLIMMLIFKISCDERGKKFSNLNGTIEYCEEFIRVLK